MCSDAIKYTDTGSVTLRVTCLPSPQHTALQATASVGAKEGSTPLATATQPESTSEQVLLQFEVVDTGVGIPADCCDSIFKPFEHGPKVNSPMSTTMHGCLKHPRLAFLALIPPWVMLYRLGVALSLG